jgi:fatty acid amide hydrolase
MHDCLHWSAAEIARRIAAREISAREVCAAYIERCEQTHKALNALVWTRFDAALKDAVAIDERLARGETLGPLAGVPITVKDCFFVEGAPSCIGLSHLKGEIADQTGALVHRLQQADAVLLGKTNVPQLMLWHECDNPVYGRTNNPWNVERTPGGSSGGEAAIIAVHGSALGLGNDLGGSIRVPAHFCGIHGLKPTSRRLTNSGARANFNGLEAMVSAAGPMARSVEDLALALRVLTEWEDDAAPHDIEPWQLRDFRDVDVAKLKIGVWLGDDCFAPAKSIERAVREAATALENQGAQTRDTGLGALLAIIEDYVGLITADGGADLRRISKGSRLDWRVSRILMLAGMGRVPRSLVTFVMRMLGQKQMAALIRAGRPRSADEYWQLVGRRDFCQSLVAGVMLLRGYHAIIAPTFAVPAPQHGKPIDLVAAAGFSFLANLIGWPAGVVSTTTVRKDEQYDRPPSRDHALQRAAEVEAGSAGLPVGVQVISLPWREDIVLAVMAAIERELPRPQLPNSQLAAIGVKN